MAAQVRFCRSVPSTRRPRCRLLVAVVPYDAAFDVRFAGAKRTYTVARPVSAIGPEAAISTRAVNRGQFQRPDMQRASLFQLKDRFLVHPESRTTSGLWLAVSDYVTLSLNASPTELGAAVGKALDQSVDGVPHPTVWTGLSRPRLAAAGVRSEGAFMRGGRCVGVRRSEETVLKPSRNGGPTGEQLGFTDLPELRLVLSGNSTESELGNALLSALTRCEIAE